MRREGYEFQVSRPEVIFHQAEDGTQLEPYEEVHIETSPDTVGVVVEMLGGRRGKMMDMQDTGQGSARVDLHRADARLAGFPLPIPDRHARHGRDEYPLSWL